MADTKSSWPMGSSFYILRLRNLSRQLEDVVTDRALESGATGTAEQLSFEQENQFLQVTTIFSDKLALDIFFDSQPPESFLTWLRGKDSTIEMDLQEQAHQDWLAEWKKGFVPFELAAGIWVVPSWLEAPSEAQRSIRIDPGMAFGTGTHETTQMAAEMIMTLSEHDLKSVLDVGAGTGILSLVAAIRGAHCVRAIEIDELAREVARENLEKNRPLSDAIEVVDHLLENETDHFSLVVANIIDGILMQMRPHLLRALSQGGLLLLSGILDERAEEFLQAFSGDQSEVRLIQQRERGIWRSYLFQKT